MKQLERLVAAYKRMAAFYRPGCPADKRGMAALSADQLVDPEILEAEARSYCEEFMQFDCDFHSLEAFAYVAEASRLILSGAFPAVAAELLRMALDELEKLHDGGVN
jgi:hypothetical protein